jgi:predicted Zn-dependent protease
LQFPRSSSFIAIAALLVTRADWAFAHGDLHGQIARVTEQIGKEPGNADLFLQRGELRRLHSEFPEASADFEKAAALRPDWPQVALAKSRLALSTGQFEASAAEMDQLLPKHPEYPEGWLLRARARARLGKHLDAASDYTEIVQRVERPEPDIFLERATALAATGETRFADALRGLEDGLTKLGPVMTLELAALDLQLKMKRFDDAIRRVDRLTANAPRKESWLTRRGDILARAGRANEARTAFQRALKAIDSLPPHHQATQATIDLKQRITTSMGALGPAAR